MISRLWRWTAEPFGNRTFPIVVMLFMGSVAIDLASTHYFLSRAAWNCKVENNPVSEYIFCSMGFYPGAAFIWVSETLLLFLVIFPLSFNKIDVKCAVHLKRVNVASVVSLSALFVLIGLDNWNVIDIHPYILGIHPAGISDFGKNVIAGSVFVSVSSLAALTLPILWEVSKSPVLFRRGISISNHA